MTASKLLFLLGTIRHGKQSVLCYGLSYITATYETSQMRTKAVQLLLEDPILNAEILLKCIDWNELWLFYPDNARFSGPRSISKVIEIFHLAVNEKINRGDAGSDQRFKGCVFQYHCKPQSKYEPRIVIRFGFLFESEFCVVPEPLKLGRNSLQATIQVWTENCYQFWISFWKWMLCYACHATDSLKLGRNSSFTKDFKLI